ncbi:zinc ribbon domain-containing protein [Candidatus Peregrinibacteria bacterium]|nr:zinc ribbon domain-containing protein [Candidatus Peregrinibacteria bacterium]
MPRFDFRCKKCQTTFEESLAFGSQKLPKCPACGSGMTEKLISPPAVHFKGSGWYKTDSKAAAPARKKKEVKTEAPAPEKPAVEKPAEKIEKKESN